MPPTYTATLRDGVLDWGADPPVLPPGDVPVSITLLAASEPANGEVPNGKAAMAVMAALAAIGGPTSFGDPVEWEREVRRDRPLPGRDE